MPFLDATLIAISLIFLSTTSRAQTPYATVCGSIANAVSSASRVAYPGQHPSFSQIEYLAYIEGFRTGDVQFDTDIYHFTSSSSQPAACTVQPGTVADVGKVVGRLLVSSL